MQTSLTRLSLATALLLGAAFPVLAQGVSSAPTTPAPRPAVTSAAPAAPAAHGAAQAARPAVPSTQVTRPATPALPGGAVQNQAQRPAPAATPGGTSQVQSPTQPAPARVN